MTLLKQKRPETIHFVGGKRKKIKKLLVPIWVGALSSGFAGNEVTPEVLKPITELHAFYEKG